MTEAEVWVESPPSESRPPASATVAIAIIAGIVAIVAGLTWLAIVMVGSAEQPEQPPAPITIDLPAGWVDATEVFHTEFESIYGPTDGIEAVWYVHGEAWNSARTVATASMGTDDPLDARVRAEEAIESWSYSSTSGAEQIADGVIETDNGGVGVFLSADVTILDHPKRVTAAVIDFPGTRVLVLIESTIDDALSTDVLIGALSTLEVS